jgi:hypothetical protein
MIFYLLNGFKLIKRAKNNCLLFLVYNWYFSGFIFKQIMVFLKGFWLKTIKSKIKRSADSLGPLVSLPRWFDRTGSARPSRPPHSLPLSVETLTLSSLWRFVSPTRSLPGSSELRRDPPPPPGASALPRCALTPDRGVSSPPPPIAAIAVELRPSRSCPSGLIYSCELAGASSLAWRCWC